MVLSYFFDREDMEKIIWVLMISIDKFEIYVELFWTISEIFSHHFNLLAEIVMVIYRISIQSHSLPECYLSILPNTVCQNFLCTQAFPAVSMINFLTTKHCCCQEFGLMTVFIFIAVKNIKQYRILNSESWLMLQSWSKCAYL